MYTFINKVIFYRIDKVNLAVTTHTKSPINIMDDQSKVLSFTSLQKYSLPFEVVGTKSKLLTFHYDIL